MLYHALASDTSRLTQQTTPAGGTFRCPETVHMNSSQHDYLVMMTLVIWSKASPDHMHLVQRGSGRPQKLVLLPMSLSLRLLDQLVRMLVWHWVISNLQMSFTGLHVSRSHTHCTVDVRFVHTASQQPLGKPAVSHKVCRWLRSETSNVNRQLRCVRIVWQQAKRQARRQRLDAQHGKYASRTAAAP